MAKYKEGVMGPFIGKLGPVIGSSWYGIPYMKTRPKKRTKRVSDREKQNRSKFSMAHFWLQPLLDFVREGFKDYSFTSRGFNAAKSHLLKHVFEGTAPDYLINPALVKLSVGDLPLSDTITAEKSGEKEIRFSWDPHTKDTNPFDQVMLVAYCIVTLRPTTYRYKHFERIALLFKNKYGTAISIITPFPQDASANCRPAC